MSCSSLDRAIAFWTQLGVRFQPPVTEEEIRTTFECYGHQLAVDALVLYRTISGFSDEEFPPICSFNLWTIDRIHRENPGKPRGWFWFADFLICSSIYGLRAIDSETSAVYSANFDFGKVPTPEKVADSLAEFFERLLTDPFSLGIAPFENEEQLLSKWK